MKKARYSTRTAKAWVENNIIFVEIFPNSVLDFSDAEENLNTMEKLYPLINITDSYALLIDIKGLKSISKEAVDHMINAGNFRDNSASALAMIVNTPFERMIGNFIMSFKYMKKPTKLFTNRELAIQWIGNIIKTGNSSTTV